jgi:hypothetical protein
MSAFLSAASSTWAAHSAAFAHASFPRMMLPGERPLHRHRTLNRFGRQCIHHAWRRHRGPVNESHILAQ